MCSKACISQSYLFDAVVLTGVEPHPKSPQGQCVLCRGPSPQVLPCRAPQMMTWEEENIYIIFIFGTSLLGQLSSAEDAWPLFLIFVTWLSSSSAMMLSSPSTWPTPHRPYLDSSARCPLGMTPHPLHPVSSPLYSLSPILHPRHPGSSSLYSLSPIKHPRHPGSSPLYSLSPIPRPHHISEPAAWPKGNRLGLSFKFSGETIVISCPSASVVERSSFDLAKPSWHSCNRPSAKSLSCGLK